MGWAGGPGDQLYIVSTGNTDNSSETVHQFNKDKTREKNVLLTPMEQPLRGDTGDKNLLEAAFSTAFYLFFDEENKVIRVGGRLANSPYTIDRKLPVLVPRKSPITEMLIREAHKKNLHAGPQLTLYTLRRTTWIP